METYKEHLLEIIAGRTAEVKGLDARRVLEEILGTRHSYMKPVVIAGRIENGKELKKLYCMECGAYGTSPKWPVYTWNSGKCRCGNAKAIPEWNPDSIDQDPFVRILEAQPDCVYFAYVKPRIHFGKETYDRKTVRVEGIEPTYGVLTRDNLCLYHGAWLMPDSGEFRRYAESLETCVVCPEEMQAQYGRFLGKASWKTALRRGAPKEVVEEPMPGVIPDVPMPDINRNAVRYRFALLRRKSEDWEERTIQIFCPNCKKMLEQTVSIHDWAVFTCPDCGVNAQTAEISRQRTDGIAFHNVTINGRRYFVMRFMRKEIGDINWNTGKYAETWEEIARYYVSGRAIKKYVFAGGKWRLNTNYGYGDVYWLTQTKGEVEKVVADGPEGLAVLPDLLAEYTDNGRIPFEEDHMANAIQLLLTVPQATTMYRYGLTNMAMGWAYGDQMMQVANENAEVLTEYLGVTEKQLEVLRTCNPSCSEGRVIKHLFAIYPDLTAEEYAAVKEKVNSCRYKSICEVFPNVIPGILQAIGILMEKGIQVSLTDIAKYIHSTFTEQRIEGEDAVKAWVSYLELAANLYDLSKEAVRFPGELRRALDIAVYDDYMAHKAK